LPDFLRHARKPKWNGPPAILAGHGRRFAELPAISCCLPKLCPILCVAVSKDLCQ